MSTLSLDFSDASFDQDVETYIIDPSDNLVFEMKKDGTVGTPLVDSETGENVGDDDPAGIGAISAMAISAPPGSTFDFEFIDNPEDDGTSDEDVRSNGDQYAARADVSADGVTILMNEAMFEPGLDIVNGSTMSIAIETTAAGAPTTRVEPVDVVDIGLTGTLGHNGVDWVLDATTTEETIQVIGDWADIDERLTTLALIDGQPLSTFEGDSGATLLGQMTVTVPGEDIVSLDQFNIGDGAGETWVVSGDLNGRDPSEWENLPDAIINDTIGFRPGTYDGVFLGGKGFDTLRFDHNNSDGDFASEPTKMFVDLASGTAMFGNGQSSPYVQFAEVGGAAYDLDWERLELVGESNDTVIVGGGIGLASDNTGLTSTGDAIVDGFFEMSLGMGEDQVYVNDTSTGITLDLSGADDSYVDLYEYGEDHSEAEVYTNAGEDSGYIEMEGWGDGGVLDYIYAGDNNDLFVYNDGEDGVVVDFGLNGAGGSGEDHNGVTYYGEDGFESYSDNDAIDLRGMDSVEILGEASEATILVSETVGAGEDAVDMTAAIYAQDVESIFVTQSGNDSDTDVLVDMSHLYGEDAGILGQGVEDVSGGTYDVATSAHLDSFGSETDPMQIYYDGDHNAFVDTNDHLSWTSAETDVAHDVGVNSEQKGWSKAVADNDSGGAATPSFYVEVAGQKVAVYLDQTDVNDVSWKVDTSAFAITSDAYINSMNGEDVIETLEEAYGVSINGEDLADASNVYLNASESDIEDLLYAGSGEDELDDVMRESAYDFGFYTQVRATEEGGGQTFVNVALDYNAGSWSISDDASTRVQTDYNTVETGDSGTAIGGIGSDFIELGSQGAEDTNFAMGNAGGDTYMVGSGDAGLINELGNLQLNYGGIGSDSDAVQFELVNSIDELTFTRTKVAGEKEGSTLKIDAAGDKGSASLFDQYNEFLDFRKTEFLVLDDGATRDEVFALVTDTDHGTMDSISRRKEISWDNEIYVAHANEAMTVDLGGTDYVFLGDDQANSVTVNIDQILMGGDSGSVTVSGIENDNLDVVSMLTNGEDIVSAYDAVKADADSAHISWGENSDGHLEINIDVYDDDGDDLLSQTHTMIFEA